MNTTTVLLAGLAFFGVAVTTYLSQYYLLRGSRGRPYPRRRAAPLSLVLAILSGLSVWVGLDWHQHNPPRINNIHDNGVYPEYIITGDGIESYRVGQNLVAYGNLPVNERVTNESIETPVALLHVVGLGAGYVRAQATLIDANHPLQPNMRVDAQTDRLAQSLLVPADPQAVGYVIGEDLVRLRPGVAPESGMLLEALTQIVQDQAVVASVPFQPDAIYRITVISTDGAFVRIVPEPGAPAVVALGTLVRLRTTATTSDAVSGQCGGEPLAFPRASEQSSFDKSFGLSRYTQQGGLDHRVNGLAQNIVRSIFVDTMGVWIGYGNNGSGRPNEQGVSLLSTGAFAQPQVWEHCRSAADTPLGTHINAINRSPDGELWIATDGDGVWRLGADGWRQYTPSNSSFPSVSAYVITFREGRPLVGTLQGLTEFVGTAWQPIAIPLARDDLDRRVHAVAVAPDRSLWIGLIDRGVVHLQTDGRASRFDVAGGQLLSDRVRSIVLDARGQVWVGTDGGGINLYDGSGWRSLNLGVGNVSAQSVTALKLDHLGRVWAATEIGAFYWASGDWHQYSNSFTSDISFGTARCADCQLSADHVWTATRDGITHSQLPAASPIVLQVAVTGVPDHINPGQAFAPTVTLTLEAGLALGDGDFLSNVSGDQSGVPLVRPARIAALPDTYVFEFVDRPLVAPPQSGVCVSQWRLWQGGRYVGPIIEIAFNVADL